METINNSLADLLQTVQTPGDFYAAGSCPMHLPLMEVVGVGPIALPLLPAQAKQLIAAAERAPYGRGGETLVDTAVRRTWQIGADRVRIAGKHWPQMLAGVVERAAAGLGAGTAVVPELYKLLIYDEGSFFVSHRDTEKSAGMFATLIIALPSVHEGGELVLRHRGREVRLPMRSTDPSEAEFAAFYADCLHEVLPVTSGCRLALVYNLLRKGKGRLPRPPSYERETAALSQLLRRWSGQGEAAEGAESAGKKPAVAGWPTKLVYPLEHAYTPAELSFAALKGADAAAAGVLATAARDAACELHVALLRIEESGSAEYSGYRGSRYHRRYRDDDDDDENDDDDSADDFEISEIFERSLTLAHWSRPDASAAALGALPFTDAEVCPGDALQDMDPDEQHFEEATGNEGASFERTYQRAALVLWPQARRLAVVAHGGFEASLPYLADLVQRWVDAGSEPQDEHWRDAHALVGQMLSCWPARANAAPDEGKSAAATVLTQLVRLRDDQRIDAVLSAVMAAGAYGTGDNAAIVRALKLLLPARACELLRALVQANADLHIGGCADLLVRAGAVAAWRAGIHGAARALLDAMPGGPANKQAPPNAWWCEAADARLVHDALRALVQVNADLADRAVSHWLAWPKTYSMDTVIVPALRWLADWPAALREPAGQRLRAAALAHLQARVALPLAPPADWQRGADVDCRCGHCQGLSRFLQSATEAVWRFKARESDRSHVHDSIREGRLDISCTTERKGSPHVLVCTKTQASYERRVKQRRADLEDLARLGA